jgi:hypothetical protein
MRGTPSPKSPWIGTESRYWSQAEFEGHLSEIFAGGSTFKIITQVQQGIIESVAVKRTKEISLNGSVFRCTKVSRPLYFGFIRQQEFFIATPEKALLDAVCLMSFGRYALDLAAIDDEKFNRKEIQRMSRNYPSRTRKMLEKHGYLGPA